MKPLTGVIGAAVAIGVILLMTAASPTRAASPLSQNPQALVHTCASFEFVAKAPIEVTWPLFGAHEERSWAPGWDPISVWPENAADQEGMVFKIAHGHKTAIWLATAFDPAAMNRVQYVYVIPELVATVITLKLTPREQWTHVVVTYERTALSHEADELVSTMAAHDKLSGPEWERQINEHLDSKR